MPQVCYVIILTLFVLYQSYFNIIKPVAVHKETSSYSSRYALYADDQGAVIPCNFETDYSKKVTPSSGTLPPRQEPQLDGHPRLQVVGSSVLHHGDQPRLRDDKAPAMDDGHGGTTHHFLPPDQGQVGDLQRAGDGLLQGQLRRGELEPDYPAAQGKP